MSSTATTEPTNNATGSNQNSRGNGKQSTNNTGSRVISNPNDVASLVLMQVDAVNAKKDELTIAIKGLTDTTKQLVRAYAEHAKAIQKLQSRIAQLEDKNKGKTG